MVADFRDIQKLRAMTKAAENFKWAAEDLPNLPVGQTRTSLLRLLIYYLRGMMHAYERQAYEMADGRYTPMGEARLWEIHTYGMAYARCTPMRDTPMRWPCEKHVHERCAYEKHAYEMHTYERHAYEMACGRGTPMRDARI
jgi:hypothetical protein